ncbi:MAG: hypothetical protein Q8M65_03845, partial [Rhodoglobus sp.]|nr:hypothetical protein [Rhodoglobus sp.]
GTELACNDDIVTPTNTASSVSVGVFAGQVLYLVVDGFDAAASGSYVLNIARNAAGTDGGATDVPSSDPCSGVTYAGRCATATSVEYCSVTTETGSPHIERYACGAGERCAIRPSGYADCVPTATCRTGDVECIGPTQLRQCAGGSWVSTTCPRECISSPIGDFCGANLATRVVTGRVMYMARGPNDASRPSGWSTTAFAASAQSFLVLSVRRNSDGTVSNIDAVPTSVGTSDGGRFSIRVPTVPTASDSIIVMAAAGDGNGGISYVVARPGFTRAGEQFTGAPAPAPSLWFWEWAANRFVSGDTLTITESMGSGAARIFDYLRYTYGYVQGIYGRPGLPLVAWLQFGTSWSCGACMARRPTTLFGSGTAPGLPFQVQGYFDGSIAQGYWSDPVTAHEFGQWVMSS